jgi:tRNA(fMet)-specific endonuclease VapC
MTKYLLDTNICVFNLRGKYNLDEKLKTVEGLHSCCISEITIAELKYGAECSDNITKNMQLIDNFLTRVGIVPINTCIGLFAKEKARLKKIGAMIDDFDLLIGCSAVANNLIMVTDNKKHFNRIEKITIENWIQSA